MSAPMTKSQMAFELPRLSYIDTRWEEPDVQSVPPRAEPTRHHGFASWIAAGAAPFRSWLENERARTELSNMTDHQLCDVGLNRGDLDRVFDDRFNQDLLARGRVI